MTPTAKKRISKIPRKPAATRSRRKPAAVSKKPSLPPEPAVTAVAPAAADEGRKKEAGRYTYALGRRKTAVAKLRLVAGGDGFKVNGRPFEGYFRTRDLQRIALSPLALLGLEHSFGGELFARGGGIRAQAEAVRHAIARALVLENSDHKPAIKRAGFLTRDPRVKERKKPGLKRARRGPQWAKR